MRSNRVAFRRAVLASVAFHVALAVAVVFVVRSRPEPKPAAPGIDTRADDVVIRFFADEVAIATQPPDVPPPSPAPSPESAEVVEGTGGSRPPLASIVPHTLPPEMLAIIRRPVADPNVKPAGATSLAVRAIHGAMQPEQTVVYVLDCSGSMGEFGKLALARAALVATLRAQPEGVRFQVIVYNSTARVISGAGCVPATPSNITVAEAKIAAVEATGRSNHVSAVRVAAQSRPDVILLLTDAEDLAPAQFKQLLAGVNKPITLCVAKVTAAEIQTPQELR
jgi:hypothetical protein